MTVDDAFGKFKSALELTDAEQDKAAAAQKAIRERTAAHFFVYTSFLAGSYARYTKIAPLCDIDVFLVRNTRRVAVSTDGSGVLPHVALAELAHAVAKAYPNGAKVKMQSRSVNVEIAGLSFGFDLMPAWYRSPDGYWIPDTDTGTWIATDPERHATLMTEANEKCDKKLKPLIKMAKHWSRNNHDLLRSFHIELICREIFATRKITTWQLGMAWFLVGLPAYIGKPMIDPVYGLTRADKVLTEEEGAKLLARVNYDGNNAIEAVELENTGTLTNAIEKWTSIFVSGFPS